MENIETYNRYESINAITKAIRNKPKNKKY